MINLTLAQAQLALIQIRNELAAKPELLNDAEHWITVNGGEHPETGEKTGKHVLINGEGEVIGGAGGALNGKKLEHVKSKSVDVEKPKDKEPEQSEASSDVKSEVPTSPEGRSERMNIRATQGPTASETGDALRAMNERIKKPVEPRATNNSTETHIQTINDLRSGNISAEDYKKAFSDIVEHKDKVIEELNGLTKDKLLSMGGVYFQYQYKNDKKDRVISALYNNMLHEYHMGDSISYSMGEKAEDVLKRQIDKATDEHLANYAGARKKAEEDYQKEKAERLEGIKDPKSLDDFENYMRVKMNDEKMNFHDSRMTLSAEQRKQYDLMKAQQNRKEREARQPRKESIRDNTVTTESQVKEIKHTKTGETLFTVNPSDRVDRAVYDDWNSTAKRFGGSYSRFTRGFLFKNKESAEAFNAYLSKNDTSGIDAAATAATDAYHDNKSQSAVERLNTMADRLESSASEQLGMERKTNTHRRAGIASRMEERANRDIAMANTMRNISAAIENKSAEFLDKVRTKKQVEFLDSTLRNANWYQEIAPENSNRRMQGVPVDENTADYAKLPQFRVFRSDLAKLGRQLSETEGFKKYGKQILDNADDVSPEFIKFAKANMDKLQGFRTKDGNLAVFGKKADADKAIENSGFKGQAISVQTGKGKHAIILSPSEAAKRGIYTGNDDMVTLPNNLGMELVNKIGKSNRAKDISLPWQFENAANDLKVLEGLGIGSPAEYRSALREYQSLKTKPKELDHVKQLERSMAGDKSKDGLDFFPTPATTVNKMVDIADIQPGMKVLEPSAGWGHIADVLRDSGIESDVIELSSKRQELLKAKGYNVVGSDFLEHKDGGYDRIIMNPPFSDRRDSEHVKHAFDLLNKGGRMVAIVGEGVFFGNDKKAQEFRDWLDSVGGTDEKLEQDTFKDKSLPVNTGANARMIVINK